jgi:hypothetical protein
MHACEKEKGKGKEDGAGSKVVLRAELNKRKASFFPTASLSLSRPFSLASWNSESGGAIPSSPPRTSPCLPPNSLKRRTPLRTGTFPTGRHHPTRSCEGVRGRRAVSRRRKRNTLSQRPFRPTGGDSRLTYERADSTCEHAVSAVSMITVLSKNSVDEHWKKKGKNSPFFIFGASLEDFSPTFFSALGLFQRVGNFLVDFLLTFFFLFSISFIDARISFST